MGVEGITQNTKVLGNTRPAPPPLGECAVALGRYAVLFSTAPRPLRLSALQNACVCPCMGAYYNAELGKLQINAFLKLKFFIYLKLMNVVFLSLYMTNGKVIADFPIPRVILFLIAVVDAKDFLHL